jgi:methyl-accepting chemotaxis protein
MYWTVNVWINGMVFAHTPFQTKLLVGFLVTTLFSLLVISSINFYSAREQLRTETLERLTAIREAKKAEIEKTFRDLTAQCLTMSESTMSIEAMKAFRESFYAVDVSDTELEQYKQELTHFYEQEFLPKINEVATTKKTISDFFPQDRKTIIFQTRYIARNPNSLASKREYNGIGDGTPYDKAHMFYHSIYTKYITRFGFSDVYFIDPDTGYVLFNIDKETDYATNLLTGPFKETLLADTFRECQKTSDENFVKITDFEFYDPLYGTPTSFIGTPLFWEGKKIGILIVQFPINTINSIMTYDKRWSDVGLGTTGEVYLRGSDKLMRSISRSFIEDRTNYLNDLQKLHVDRDTIDKMKIYNTTILLQKVGDALEKMQDGSREGTIIDKDYLEHNALLAFEPITIQGLQWSIIAKINSDEAFAPIATRAKWAIFWSLLILVLIFIFSFMLVRKTTSSLMVLVTELAEYKQHPLQTVTPAMGSHIGIIAEAYNSAITYAKNLIEHIHTITIQIQQVTSRFNTLVSIGIRSCEESNTHIENIDTLVHNAQKQGETLQRIMQQHSVYMSTMNDKSTELQKDEAELQEAYNRTYATTHQALGSYSEMQGNINAIEQAIIRIKPLIESSHGHLEESKSIRETFTSILASVTTHKEIARILQAQLIAVEQQVTFNTQTLPLRIERYTALLTALHNIQTRDKEYLTTQQNVEHTLLAIQQAASKARPPLEHSKQQLQDMQLLIEELIQQELALRKIVINTTTPYS